MDFVHIYEKEQKNMPFPTGKGVFLSKLFYDERLQFFHDLVTVVAVRGECDGIHEVKAENTHDGLCIHNVSAAGKVDVTFELANNFYEIANCLNRIQANFYSLHIA